MSYDVTLVADTGGAEPVEVFSWNYTSNCAPMWRKAGVDIAEFDGQVAADCAVQLEYAIAAMECDPQTYVEMNPSNGWGSYETLLPALHNLLAAMRAHPKTKVDVWR